jgi:hypothetical protein
MYRNSEEAIAIALKLLTAGALAALVVGSAPAAQADPADPGTPCFAAGCQQPQSTTSPSIRGVLGCVRGVCIPKPNPPYANSPK